MYCGVLEEGSGFDLLESISVVLFQAVPCRKLQFSAVFLHGNIYPCTALIILDNPSYLTVDAVYCTNHLLTAVITGNLFDVFRDFVSSAL